MYGPIDAAIVLIVALAGLNGYRSGLIVEIAGLVRLLIGVLAGVRLFPLPAAWLSSHTTIPAPLTNVAGFLAIFLAAELILSALYAAILYPLVDALHLLPGLGVLDRLLGMVPAALQALIWIAFALGALLLLPISPALQDQITRSTLGNALVVDLSRFEPRLQGLVGNAARTTLLYLTPPPDATEGSIPMRFPPDLHLSPDPAAEQAMLTFVNAQRTERGLAPLRLDPALTALARAHSEDMFRRAYFSHDNPDGQTPFDRMRALGIGFAVAGENIAYAPNSTIANTGLMNSPEHRDNILRPSFTRVGIGVISGGIFEEMFTQDFAG